MSTADGLIKQGDMLFQKRSQLMSLWQDLADNFYPERADFTVKREVGTEFASGLMSGYPLIVRRELGNAFSAMLRPRDRAWFSITTNNEEELDHEAKEWLERATEIQRRAMYDRNAQFVRATKEGDNDFATFGQCAISRDIDWSRNTLLFRCWHLRDVAWCEDYSGMISEVHRKWQPQIREVAQLFPGKLHNNIVKRLEKEPYETVDFRHIVMPSDKFAEGKYRTPYVSVYVDVENRQVVEITGSHSRIYTIPRWQTVSGSQYAYSPATVVGLPDARLLQAMTLTLLEAGETAVRPPLVATQEAIRSDVSLYAGGITWVDAEYDERLGEVLRPITQDKRGLPFGMEMQADMREMLAQAFFLNKIALPPAESGREMTAFETAQRVQEYIRNALPLFEPMEIEYNGSLCEDTFDALLRVGAFGPLNEVPRALQGAEVRFKFESPLHRALEREKSARFQEGRALVLEALEIDPKSVAVLDVRKALREALAGAGVPTDWTRDEDEVEAMAAAQEQAEQMAQAAAIAEQAGKAGKEIGQAEQSMQQAASLRGL